jgi:predicted phosphodiesterase
VNREEILELAIDLANETGVVPKRDDFCKLVSKHVINKIFGSFAEMIIAAGLGKTTKDPAIFTMDRIRSTGNIIEPRLYNYPKILCIGDIHSPFQCDKSLQFIVELAAKIKPEYIVILGDEYDFFSMSKFPKQIIITPQEEVDKARKVLTKFCSDLHISAPKAKKYMLRGNHSIRPIKRLIEAAPELLPFFEFDKFFKFDNFETVLDTREVLEISGIAFTHGFMNHGAHMKKLMKPVVHGHTHRGGIIFEKFMGKWLWELDAGYLGDPSTVAFNYTPIKEARWTRGVGLITEYGPHFIPFEE